MSVQQRDEYKRKHDLYVDKIIAREYEFFKDCSLDDLLKFREALCFYMHNLKEPSCACCLKELPDFRTRILYSREYNKLLIETSDTYNLTITNLDDMDHYCYDCLLDIIKDEKLPARTPVPFPFDFQSIKDLKDPTKCHDCGCKCEGFSHLKYPVVGESDNYLTDRDWKYRRLGNLIISRNLCWGCSGFLTELNRWKGMDTSSQQFLDNAKNAYTSRNE